MRRGLGVAALAVALGACLAPRAGAAAVASPCATPAAPRVVSVAGRPDPRVAASLGAVRRPRWRATRLPDAGRGGLAAYGLRSGYLDQVRLWGAAQGVAYWLVPTPGLGADGCPGGSEPGVCAVAVAGRRATGALCATTDQLGAGVRASFAGGADFGFAPGDGGRVELDWNGGGSAFAHVDGGFWVDAELPALGAPDRVSYDAAGSRLHAIAPIVVLSAGAPPARTACVVRRIARLHIFLVASDSHVVDLGRATTARRASSFVMAYPDVRGHARAVARALGIRTVRPYSGGYGRLLRPAGIIAVVLGTRARCA